MVIMSAIFSSMNGDMLQWMMVCCDGLLKEYCTYELEVRWTYLGIDKVSRDTSFYLQHWYHAGLRE